MAWIKLRTDLLNDPAVYRLAADLKLDRYAIVGRLAAFWGWADQHAVDGVVDGATSQVVDDVVSLPGFADALARVKWLHLGADKVTIPNHDRHNGANAKERSLKSERQAKWRASKPPEKASKSVDAPVDGAASTREEKRREEKDTPPGFARFWLTWPKSQRKEARGECLKAWKKAGAEAVADTVVAHVESLKASPGWTKDNGQFIPAPLVYLNQRRWEGADLNTEPEKRMVV
jgi:hypothetical protein